MACSDIIFMLHLIKGRIEVYMAYLMGVCQNVHFVSGCNYTQWINLCLLEMAYFVSGFVYTQIMNVYEYGSVFLETFYWCFLLSCCCCFVDVDKTFFVSSPSTACCCSFCSLIFAASDSPSGTGNPVAVELRLLYA